MRTLIYYKILLLSVLIFSGCSIATTQSTLHHAENKYINHSVDNLIMAIGTPISQYPMSNGDILYQFHYVGTINMPTTVIHNTTGYANSYGNYARTSATGTSTVYGGASERECKMGVLVSSNKIIKQIMINRDTFGTEPLTASMCAQMFRIN